MSARLLTAAAASALLLIPEAAQACAVCFSGSDETREAFIYTAVALTFLPLSMVGGFIVFFVRRSRQIASEIAIEDASRPNR